MKGALLKTVIMMLVGIFWCSSVNAETVQQTQCSQGLGWLKLEASKLSEHLKGLQNSNDISATTKTAITDFNLEPMIPVFEYLITDIGTQLKAIDQKLKEERTQNQIKMNDAKNTDEKSRFSSLNLIIDKALQDINSIKQAILYNRKLLDECYIQMGVDRAITLKEVGSSLESIIQTIDTESTAPNYYQFGSAKSMTTTQQVMLKKAFGNDDFINNWMGVESRISIGAGPVYLKNINELVGGAIIRVMLTPRNYYTKINPFPWSRDPYNIPWKSRFDFVLGLTSTTQTDSKSYAFSGLSYELHREAHLTVGYAAASPKPGDSGQIFVGIILDKDVFKTVGLMK